MIQRGLTQNQRDALESQSPCSGCLQWRRCRVEKIACVDYGVFVNQGIYREQSRNPTRKRYLMLFVE